MSSELNVGEFLRAERERRGITLEQIAASTKINIRLLRALEANLYNELPAKPFVRSFIRSYCIFLGIPAVDILQKFDGHLTENCKQQEAPENKFTGYAFEKRDQEQSRKVLWAVLGSFAVIGGIALLILKPTLKHRRNKHLDKLQQENAAAEISAGPTPTSAPLIFYGPVPSPVPASIPSPVVSPSGMSAPPLVAPKQTPSPQAASPTPTPIASPTPAPSPSPTPSVLTEDRMHKGSDIPLKEIKEKLLIKVAGNTQVRYQVDDQKVMTFVLKDGLMLSLKARGFIKFQCDRPDQVQYKIPGKTGYVKLETNTLTVEGKTPQPGTVLFSDLPQLQ